MTGDRHAWTPGRDPVDLRRSVAAAHERFLSSGRPPEGLRTVVRDSWQRCLRVGVDPDRVSPGSTWTARSCAPAATPTRWPCCCRCSGGCCWTTRPAGTSSRSATPTGG
ncbi:hypothetical protein ACFQXA_06340 [Nocardiopsis composta]